MLDKELHHIAYNINIFAVIKKIDGLRRHYLTFIRDRVNQIKYMKSEHNSLLLQGRKLDDPVTSENERNKIVSVLALHKINELLIAQPAIGREKQIGHTFLLELQKRPENFVKVWQRDIIPLLEEYYFESPDELEKMFNKKLFETRDGIKEFDEKSLRDALDEYTKPPPSST